MKDIYNVSSSPHVFSEDSTTSIMADVIIALIPASIFGIYNFGIKALLMILTCIVASLLTEYIYEKAMKLPITTGDLSAIVTGLLLGLNMPSGAPLWMGAVGGIFAILVVKMFFGGIGQNFMNPALAARVFLVISFAGIMADFSVPNLGISDPTVTDYIAHGALAVDGITGATPLTALKAGGSVDLTSMFLGNTGGTIGETSAIALLIGGLYLIIKKVINWRIPVLYLGSLVMFMGLFGGQGFDISFIAAHLFGGGLMIGALFMATDYTTSPVTATGRVIYGIMLGVMTGIFRVLGNTAEGVSFAIIFCNLFVPVLDKYIIPKSFGKGAKAYE